MKAREVGLSRCHADGSFPGMAFKLHCRWLWVADPTLQGDALLVCFRLAFARYAMVPGKRPGMPNAAAAILGSVLKYGNNLRGKQLQT